MQIGLTHYLVLSALLFSIGIYGVLTRRNAVAILMCVELMLNAVNINFAAFSRYMLTVVQGDQGFKVAFAMNMADPNAFTGQIFAGFVIALAAAEACVGFALVISIYRNFNKISVEDINILKW